MRKEPTGQLFSVRRVKTNWKNLKGYGSIYTLQKMYTCSVQSILSQKNKQIKQTDECTLDNFLAIYQSPTDNCRGKTSII